MAHANRSIAIVMNKNALQCPYLSPALDGLRETGREVETFTLSEIGNAAGYDVIVAAGGDGTLNKVVAEILKSDSSSMIGVLPYGTGNDFATACGISDLTLSAALQVFVGNNVRMIDVGMLDDHPFINAVSGGFGAEVTSETSDELKSILGRLAYTVAGFGKLFQVQDRRAVVRGKDFQWKGHLLFLSIANGRLAGGGYHVAPRATLDDGLLDVLVVPDEGILESPPVLIELFGLGLINTEHVRYIRTPWLEVETPKGIQLSIDGEPHHADSFRVEVHKQRLPFLLPSRAAYSHLFSRQHHSSNT